MPYHCSCIYVINTGVMNTFSFCTRTEHRLNIILSTCEITSSNLYVLEAAKWNEVPCSIRKQKRKYKEKQIQEHNSM